MGCDRRRQQRGSAIHVRDRGRREVARGIVFQRRQADHVDVERARRRDGDVRLRAARIDVARESGGRTADRRVPARQGRALCVPGRPRGGAGPSSRRRRAVPSAERGSSARRAGRERPRGASSCSRTAAQVSATILRVDGDTGTLTGSYRDGRFVLSHFSGARPLLLEVTPAPDGTLLLKQNKQTELVAAREGADTASAFGTPTDPGAHTTVKDAGEVFQFSFPDLDGRIVSNTDARFRGKVLLVNISGSWCPNCHDEEPFLVSLYEKYRDKGLRSGDPLVRGGRAAAGLCAPARVHQDLRHQEHGAGAGRARHGVGEAAAGRQPQRVPDVLLRRPRWPCPRHACGVPEPRQRRVLHEGGARRHGHDREAAGGTGADTW